MTIPEEWLSPQVDYHMNANMQTISVMSNQVPEDKWQFTDAAGHVHKYVISAGNNYPSLRLVQEDAYWCGTCEEWEFDEHLECKECGETIKPGTKPGPDVIRIPGVREVYLTNVPFTDAELEELEANGFANLGSPRHGDPRIIGDLSSVVKAYWDRVYLTEDEAREYLDILRQRGNIRNVRKVTS